MIGRCSACDPNCYFVHPSGPEPCDYLFIGEKPGVQEDRRQKVFVGDAGMELDGLYLPLAGLERSQVRITNVLKCRLGASNAKPTEAQMSACARYWLAEEIARCRPKVIVLLGATACKLVPEIELDKDHGMPLWLEKQHARSVLGAWEGWVWPSYHPAAGMHQTSLMIPLMQDFERLRKWWKGKWKPPSESGETYDYSLTSGLPMWHTFQSAGYNWLAVDTENDRDHPFSIQFSRSPHQASMIMADDKAAICMLKEFIPVFNGLLLHNAPHDLYWLAQMGVTGFKFRDTMQEAYHRGNLPQGLKALGWRLFGIRMKSWEDLVMPYSRARMVEWLSRAWDWASDNRERQETQLKTKLKITYRRTAMERDIARIIKHSHKPDYDIWERAEEAGLIKDELVEICGLVPRPGIGHVPIEEVVEYGCRDADVTGRVGAWMDQQPGVEIAVEDWDR